MSMNGLDYVNRRKDEFEVLTCIHLTYVPWWVRILGQDVIGDFRQMGELFLYSPEYSLNLGSYEGVAVRLTSNFCLARVKVLSGSLRTSLSHECFESEGREGSSW